MKAPDDFAGKNKELIEKFQKHLQLNGLKEGTIANKIWLVRNLIRYYNNKPLDEITKDEIEEYILHRRKTWKPKTAHNDMVEIRVFYNWLKPDNNFFEDIKRGRQRRKLPTKRPMIAADVHKLLQVCQTQRDRALTALTWDSAARIGEILNLNVGDVAFDQYGGIITVDGKTGMRRIRLVDAVPELQLWLNQHPYKNNPDRPLFTISRKRDDEFKRLSIRTVQNLFKTLGKDSGIKMNVHPHAFRHGKLTEMVKMGMKEMELRIFAGWEPGSDMPATYLHLSGEDVDKRILSIHGIVTEEDQMEKDEDLKPIECPRCQMKNPHDSKYCSSCSMVLDKKTAIKLDTEMKTADDKLTQLMQSKVDELVEARINEVLKKMNY